MFERMDENCSCVFGISAIHGGQMCEFEPARSCRGAQVEAAASSFGMRLHRIGDAGANGLTPSILPFA